MMSSEQKSHRDRVAEGLEYRTREARADEVGQDAKRPPGIESRATARARSMTSRGVAGLGALLLLSCAAACGEGEGGAPVPAADDPAATLERWFVELDATPSVRGGQLKAMNDKVASFRQAATAASIPFVEQRRFGVLWPGLSVMVPRSEVQKLRALPGVRAIHPVLAIPRPERPAAVSTQPRPEMHTSVGMIGADIARTQLGLTGRGVRVAIIDTGVDHDHPDLGGCFGPGCRVAFGYDLVGDAFNQAVPGSQPIPDSDPDDCGGHGSHVAGTVGASGTLTGVAPEVTFGAYRVFGCEGSTSADIMLEAMERAYADGMRVINMSIGSAFTWPTYPTAVAVATLTERGVVVATSIGNSGAIGLWSTSAPGNGDASIGVAAIDNTHVLQAAFAISDDNRLMGYNPATGAPPPPTTGSLVVARTGTITTPNDGCDPRPAGSLTGKAALIRRGTCPFAQKSLNAQNAGAAAVILYNNQPGQLGATVAGGGITIPVVGITAAFGEELNRRMDAPGFELTMTWTDDLASAPQPTAGLVSSFSSSGPTADLGFKPDLAAPGGSIYSTYPLEKGGYATSSGTSMASPHVAGAAALLIQARPGILPAEVRDILQNTAVPVAALAPNGTAIDATLRQGAGLIHIDVAAQVKAVVTPAKLPLGEGVAAVTRTLTVKNLGTEPVTYTLSHAPTVSVTGTTWIPAFAPTGQAAATFSAETVTVAVGSQATFDVTITPADALADKGIYGGYVVLTPASGATLRVPYMGFKGDYQTLRVLAPLAAGYPWLANNTPAGFVNNPTGGTFTLVGADQPYLVMHMDHFAQRLIVDVTDTDGKQWGRYVDWDYLSHGNAATSVLDILWNGTATRNGRFVRVPSGTYLLKLSVLKPLGDENEPSHWETWTSPPVTIDRP